MAAVNRIAVVGASVGGVMAAEALRRGGFTGGITLVGDEPWPAYERPPLSKEFLSGQWPVSKLALRDRTRVDDLSLEQRLGVPACGLELNERQVVLADGDRVGYDALVVATGVRARRVEFTDAIGVHVLRTVRDAAMLRSRLRPGRRLVIVGGGFIGCEVAATAIGLGVQVTLLEAMGTPLGPLLGSHVGEAVRRLHKEHGVDVRSRAVVEDILTEGKQATGVRLLSGEAIAADDVLVAVGSEPNTEWLAGSGLLVDGGLVCDEYSAASPDVYGVGDVARWYNPLFDCLMRVEHRTNAAEQALAVARNILNPQARRPFAPVPYFWSDQYGLKFQAYGQIRGHDEALVLHHDSASHSLLVAYRKRARLCGIFALGQSPKALREWRTLIAQGHAWEPVLQKSATHQGARS
ncbi:NAD(P)/FAD-dependent oxidoreductase [Streptomyces griseus]|uniref:NAD(P)/FAD-dependent oxidoreductase n=1 Tax=Streptomyces griseus TaxID=1911 RepID=UPI00341A91C2